jgi:hypothetical protein
MSADKSDQRVLIVRVAGDVKVDGKAVGIGDSIRIGAIILATGERSYVQFQFASGSLIMLRDGEMKVSKIKKKSTVMDLVKGTIFSFIKKQDGNEVKVRTSSAAIGIRGTKFITTVTPTSTYLCVCDGVVNIKNKKGNIDINAGEEINVTLVGAMSKAKTRDQMSTMLKEGFAAMGMEIPDLK